MATFHYDCGVDFLFCGNCGGQNFQSKGHLVGFATSTGESETECDPISRWISQSMTDLGGSWNSSPRTNIGRISCFPLLHQQCLSWDVVLYHHFIGSGGEVSFLNKILDTPFIPTMSPNNLQTFLCWGNIKCQLG